MSCGTGGFAEIQVVSFADLNAGKLVAALDRQHPRDLFDVRDLLANEGVTDELRKAFVVYIISHNRPVAEVLAPTRQDITQEFERGFVGITEDPVSLDERTSTGGISADRSKPCGSVKWRRAGMASERSYRESAVSWLYTPCGWSRRLRDQSCQSIRFAHSDCG